jgi:Fe-S cluster assembly protein SufD
MSLTANDTKSKLLSSFENLSFENIFFKEARTEAKGFLSLLDFPTSRDEYWKYTRLAKLIGKLYKIQKNTEFSLPQPILTNTQNLSVSFVNGFYHSQNSNTQNFSLSSFSELKSNELKIAEEHLSKHASCNGHIFTAINTAYFTDGVFINIPEKTDVAQPVCINHYISGNEIISNFRTLLIAEKNSRSTIIFNTESVNASDSFANIVTEILVEENAKVDFYLIQNENKNCSQIHTVQVQQKASSSFAIHTISLSGELVRNNLNIVVKGANCETILNGLYVPVSGQHIDNHTLVDHKFPHCNSSELYKGVMSGKSNAVFNGKVFVRPLAQKTNAYQSNQNILLSDDANVNSKPELEIYADDVKCSHGSTTGQLDDDAMFYLRARGINSETAKKILIGAFLGEVIESIKPEDLKTFISEKINTLLTY